MCCPVYTGSGTRPLGVCDGSDDALCRGRPRYTAVLDDGSGNREGNRNWQGMVGLESAGPVGGRLEGAETMSRLWFSADLTSRLIFLFTEERLQWVSVPATSGEARLVLPLTAGLGVGY